MSQQHLMSKDLELLESGLFADATITCGDRTWKVHKSIICRCEWFKKAFGGNFEEAQTNNVNISDVDFSPEVVDCAITFIYSGVADIKKLNTNHSVPDACVRLWVIADFLVFKELQNEAVNSLERYCDGKVKAMCTMTRDKNEEKGTYYLGLRSCKTILPKLFRGVETAYAQYPHSVPCQQVLINFFYALRAILFREASFTHAASKAPPQFSQELFIATIEGRVSKWTPKKLPKVYDWASNYCTYCQKPANEHLESAMIDPSMCGLSETDRVFHLAWRCTPCFQKHGFDRAPEDGEKG